jgi:hypothetical protein
METLIRNKIREYREKFIEKPGYVVELGSYDMNGGMRTLFEDADDFCGIDTHRGPGVDIVSEYCEVGRLFDYNPDTIICLDIFPKITRTKTVIRGVRETLIAGGFIIVAGKVWEGGSVLDALFSGYEVFDLSTAEGTICGIAKKPYRISYDTKTDARWNHSNYRQ